MHLTVNCEFDLNMEHSEQMRSMIRFFEHFQIIILILLVLLLVTSVMVASKMV